MIPPHLSSSISRDSTSQRGRGAKQRLVSLLATAALASCVGVVLGSTMRFHMAAVGKSTPLFQPQQDFPPLAEWPPAIPLTSGYGDFDTLWAEEESEVPQLVYRELPSSTEASFDAFSDENYTSGNVEVEGFRPQTAPITTTLREHNDHDNNLSATPVADEILPSDSSQPDVEEFGDIPIREFIPENQLSLPTQDNQKEPQQWFQKQPRSTVFTDSENITSSTEDWPSEPEDLSD